MGGNRLAVSASGEIRRSSSTRNDWETPQWLFDILNEEFNFTLDAAASPLNTKCKVFITKEQNALDPRNSWLVGPNESIWLNPPYGGRDLQRWIARCSQVGTLVVALLPVATGTLWFRDVFYTASEIRFITGRVNFVGSTSGNTSDSMIVIWDWKHGQPVRLSPTVRLVRLNDLMRTSRPNLFRPGD